MDSSGGAKPFSQGAIHKDCADGLVIQMFYGSNKVDTNVVFPHGCP